MSRSLDVYLHRRLTGQLTQDDGGQVFFAYAQSWLEDFAPTPLSQSLPLRKERFNQKECAGFFGGILPEADLRETVAKNLGISAKNDFAMLEGIGGECAGAVTFMPAGVALPERDHRYRELSHEELAAMLRSLPRRPLLAGERDVRLSLAGAQDKIPVRVDGENILLPLGEAVSTHILKLASARFPGLVANESLCLDLARAIGLSAAKAEIRKVDDIEFLLVERYDRALMGTDKSRRYERLHQEDFCQALGVVSERKYQAEGGPSLKQCFDLLRSVSSAPVIDLQRLLDAVIFNLLIGNNDVHAKNYSLLYGMGPQSGIRLLPLYDLVCTIYYPELSPRMAMKIGGEYLPEHLSTSHFEKMAEEAGLAKPAVRRRVPEIAQSLLDALEKLGKKDALPIAHTIEQQSRSILARFAA